MSLSVADFLGGAQRGQDQPVFLDLDGADALARAHHQPADRHLVLLGHGGADDREGFDAGLGRRHEVIGRVPVQPVDRGARDELLDVDDAGRFELHRVELVLVEQDVFALGDLVALHQVAARDLFAGAGVDGLHLDAVVGLGIDQIEANGRCFGRRRIERNGTGNEGETQVALPRRTRSHVDPSCGPLIHNELYIDKMQPLRLFSRAYT